MAVEEGKLKESDKVTQYVPELKQASAFADATFGQVIDMTNSMDFTDDYADPRSGIRTYGAVPGWTAKVEGVEYPKSLYDYLVTLKMPPASRWQRMRLAISMWERRFSMRMDIDC